jgi:formamidopyrimidine-DNA glycosylase
MGPEPLENSFSGSVLQKRLKGKKSPIKTALLDQNIVAGLGNIYVCEALYMASIHPQRAANSLSLQENETLTRAIKNVLNKALKAGGSSLKDYVHTDGTLGYFQHSFNVYDRAGQSCTKCKGQNGACIKRIVQAGRSSFYCPYQQN